MEKYGIKNVRGGAYSCVDLLDEDQIYSLANEIVSANDLCNRCFRSCHFIKNCKATTDIIGNKIDTSSSDSSSSDSSSSDSESDDEPVKYKNKTVKKTPCYRCGRDGHFITSCYASTHIKGYVLK